MAPAPAKAAPERKKTQQNQQPQQQQRQQQRKQRKAKSEKKHKEEKGVKAMYKVEGEKFSRARPTCERCGPGYFMADHHGRYTCGHCGLTRYKQK